MEGADAPTESPSEDLPVPTEAHSEGLGFRV